MAASSRTGARIYRVCSRSRLEPRQLSDVVLDHLPQLLPSPEAPVFAAPDDTILKKTGRRIPGVKILRDPMSLPFHVNLCHGLRFVQASVPVSPREADGPARFDFAPPATKPKKNAPPEGWAYKEDQKNNREVLKRLPERTTFTGRIRRDAKLYYPLPATGPRSISVYAPAPDTERTPPRTDAKGVSSRRAASKSR